MTKAFDPGNGKFYKNIKEHITKQAQNGDLGDKTKKRVQDMMKPNSNPNKDDTIYL